VAYRRRSVLGLLLVFVFAASATLAPCGGWQASAKARMACCAGGDHECSQARADDCCVAGEQRQHGETFANGATLIPRPAFVSVLVSAPLAEAVRGTASSRSGYLVGSPPDTHLLLSVFLI
jgi:hypothetical protein